MGQALSLGVSRESGDSAMKFHRYRTGAGDNVYVFSSGLKFIVGCYGLLSPSEKLHAKKINTEVGRTRFVASRSFLRLAIGKFLGIDAFHGEFIFGRCGKIYLPHPYSRVYFNVSHTNNVIVAACTSKRVLGIDIERSDRVLSKNVLRHIYRPEEIESFSTKRYSGQTLLFGWVCKEAVLKCIGSGLSRDPRNISLQRERINQPSFRVLDISQKRLAAREFQVIRIDHISGVVGAVALYQSTRAQC